MSLDVDLILDGQTVFEANITHNLNRMAEACGVYHACWRPEEINATKAKHIAPMLASGIKLLEEFPIHYRFFEPENHWGTYDGFLPWLKAYHHACEVYPEATIEVSR